MHMDSFAYAATFVNPIATTSGLGFWDALFGALMYMALPIVGLAFMYVGFLFVWARGNRKLTSTATRYFYALVIATIVIFGFYMFIKVVVNTFESLVS